MSERGNLQTLGITAGLHALCEAFEHCRVRLTVAAPSCRKPIIRQSEEQVGVAELLVLVPSLLNVLGGLHSGLAGDFGVGLGNGRPLPQDPIPSCDLPGANQKVPRRAAREPVLIAVRAERGQGVIERRGAFHLPKVRIGFLASQSIRLLLTLFRDDLRHARGSLGKHFVLELGVCGARVLILLTALAWDAHDRNSCRVQSGLEEFTPPFPKDQPALRTPEGIASAENMAVDVARLVPGTFG